MTDLFEDPDAEYLVLVNHEQQRSLWPALLDVPAGWRVEHGPSPLQSCLELVK